MKNKCIIYIATYRKYIVIYIMIYINIDIYNIIRIIIKTTNNHTAKKK